MNNDVAIRAGSASMRRTKSIIGFSTALMLLVMALISGCAPIAFMMERPDYGGMELRIINAELALPEFAHFYPGKKNTSELTVSEVNGLLGKKNVVMTQEYLSGDKIASFQEENGNFLRNCSAPIRYRGGGQPSSSIQRRSMLASSVISKKCC